MSPLSGIRVVEVGAFMAAPFATMQLADLGATVIKVENPEGGDQVRAIGRSRPGTARRSPGSTATNARSPST